MAASAGHQEVAAFVSPTYHGMFGAGKPPAAGAFPNNLVSFVTTLYHIGLHTFEQFKPLLG